MRSCARTSSAWCGRTNARPAFSRGRQWPTLAACSVLDQGSAPIVRPHRTDQVEAEFRGTERFTVLRRLGAGGMGVVYAVHDGVRDEAVALKTLLRARPADVSRLKREFRSLSDIAHPNLVCLYELVVEPEHCFFTMELVDGVSVSEYVRAPVADAGTTGAEGQRADPGLVRNVLRQLVAGLSALHGKGKLHRDIKPSNIMVRRDGRVVILDFGLMSDALPGTAVADDRMAGTPAYLAPEQHAGADPSEASDWYAVGVTLYEALTGRLPFDGSWHELRSRKSHSDPPPPAWIDAGGSRRSQRDLSGLAVPRSRAAPVGTRGARQAGRQRTPGTRRHVAREPRRLKPVFVGRARRAGHPERVVRRGQRRAVRRPSAFTAPRESARPRWSSSFSTSCRTATMRWCFAADVTSTSRCHTRRSTGSSTV